MGFRITKKPAVARVVRWSYLAEDGSVAQDAVTLKFVRLGVAEYQELIWTDLAGRTPAEIVAHNARVFDAVVAGWIDFEDEDGRLRSFDDANKALLLNEPGFPGGLAAAYIEFWNAIPQLREGNSEPSPAGGREAATAPVPASAPPATAATPSP